MTGVNERRESGLGWLMFASVMLFIAGSLNIIYGIAAIVKDGYLTNHLLFQDLTFWGWLWVCVGIVEIFAAAGIATRNQYARWFGVAMATFNAIGQLAFLQASPFWSLIIIALDVLIIYGLVTYDYPIGRAGYADPYPRADTVSGSAARTTAGVSSGGAGDRGPRDGTEAMGGGSQTDTGMRRDAGMPGGREGDGPAMS
ncbi:MAG: DUF7144 family membrane protein [Frankia sp.]